MDQRAAEDYHKALRLELSSKRSSNGNFWWVPVFAATGFWLFQSPAGAVFGALLGYAICAILSRIDRLSVEIVLLEFSRHLHEYTDEAEVGKLRAEIEESVRRGTRRWYSEP